MLDGRHADSARRRQRVLATLDRSTAEGAEISVSAIARAAGVDRSFLYRHRDLLAQDPRAGRRTPATSAARRPGGHPSLAAGRPARRPRTRRPAPQPSPAPGTRLSEALGEHAWRESGLGAPADIDALHQQITHLEQQVIDLGLQLAERDEDLAAARATNREFMARLNAPHPTR